MWWANLGIRQKALLVFMVAALVPLILINLLWLRSSQTQLKQAAADKQSLLVNSSSSRVNDFINAKLNEVISHSQVQGVIDLNVDLAKISLLQYAALDSDAVRISLVDNQGNEEIVVENHAFS